MGEILFLCHRIPFPPDRGDKIRSHHILKRLARIAPVHVATFADDHLDLTEEVELASLASSFKLVRRRKSLAKAGVQALLARTPVSLSAFHDSSLADYVRQVVATRPITAIYVFSGQMGQYVPEGFSGRVIMDFVDVDSAKFEAFAARRSGIMQRIYAREGAVLRAEEARLARRADVSVLISRDEADLFFSRLPEGQVADTKITVMGNGVDSLAYDPAMVAPEPRMIGCPGPRLIFTGQMDYAPNADAAMRVIDRILPLVRKEFPQATFHVVGRNPAEELLERDRKNGVHVWGRVDDIRPWLKAADIAVIPLDIARGVQNKVLEAMAMARPVVLTPEAATGIDASPGMHFALGEDDEMMASAILYLARDHRQARRMGQAARRFIMDQTSWQAALARLPELLSGPARGVRDAA